MLSKSIDLHVKRDVVGAFMFFVVHMILLTGLSSLLIHVLGVFGVVEGAGSVIGDVSIVTLIGSLFVLWLGGSILHSRGLTSDILSVIVVGIALYLAFSMNPLVGLVPIALLTTFGKK